MAELDITTIENACTLHINNAAASLQTQEEKYAPQGVMSAATAAALSDMVMKTSGVDAHDLARFRELNARANKLVKSFWTDFKMALISRGHTEQSVQAEAEKQAKNENHQRAAYHRLSEKELAAVKQMILARPSDVSETSWYKEIAREYNCALSTVFRWAKEV